jgi:hypothetical protein
MGIKEVGISYENLKWIRVEWRNTMITIMKLGAPYRQEIS